MNNGMQVWWMTAAKESVLIRSIRVIRVPQMNTEQ
jgi:hypothetical protein